MCSFACISTLQHVLHIMCRRKRSRALMTHAPLQVMRPELLTAGFELVQQQSLEVTDDVSIIEALGKPVKITYGSYSNIKVM